MLTLRLPVGKGPLFPLCLYLYQVLESLYPPGPVLAENELHLEVLLLRNGSGTCEHGRCLVR